MPSRASSGGGGWKCPGPTTPSRARRAVRAFRLAGARARGKYSRSCLRLPSEPHEKEAAPQTIPKDDGPAQQLHRDGDLSLLEFDNELEHAIGVIWALDDDFTDERGTTRVVLGSRHWQTGHPQPAPEDSV